MSVVKERKRKNGEAVIFVLVDLEFDEILVRREGEKEPRGEREIDIERGRQMI